MDTKPVLVLGIMPGQAHVVAHTAAKLAHSLSARLACAYVQRGSALIEQADFPAREGLSLQPDFDRESEGIADGLRTFLSGMPTLREVDWDLRVLGGDPVQALSRLSKSLEAEIIIMGGVRRGFSHRAEDFISGSPATWLARNQLRPVLVVPDDRGPRISIERVG